MGLILFVNGGQTLIPLAERFFLRVGNIAQVRFRYPRHGVRRRQCAQQHSGVFLDDAVQLAGEIGAKLGMAGNKGFGRNVGAIPVGRPLVRGEDELTASAVAEEFPKTVLHGDSQRAAG